MHEWLGSTNKHLVSVEDGPKNFITPSIMGRSNLSFGHPCLSPDSDGNYSIELPILRKDFIDSYKASDIYLSFDIKGAIPVLLN